MSGPPFGAVLQFQVWRLMSAVVTTVAIVIGLTLWPLVGELRSYLKGCANFAPSLQMGAIVCFGVWLFFPREIFRLDEGWDTQAARGVMVFLVLVCFLMVALPSAIWLTNAVEVFQALKSSSNPLDVASKFKHWKEEAQLLGFLSALGITASTLPLGAWRRLVLAADDRIAKQFPPEWVILFGVYWSLSLAFAYIPVFIVIGESGRAIRDTFISAAPPSMSDFSEWRKKQLEVESFLGIEGGAADTVKLALAVLSPLIGAVLSTMIGEKG